MEIAPIALFALHPFLRICVKWSTTSQCKQWLQSNRTKPQIEEWTFIFGFLGEHVHGFLPFHRNRAIHSLKQVFINLKGGMYSLERPVFGFVYHPANSESEDHHSHEMYLITWDGRPLHVHGFSGITSFNAGHRHQYAGTTEPAPSGVPHTHGYYTATSFDDGHTHVIRGVTGPAIPIPGGGHYHFFEGVTTVNGRIPHTHTYSGRTASD
jgi:hypothetical protein